MQSLSSFFEDNKPLASVIILAALLVLIGIVFLLYRIVFGRRLRTATGGRARQPRLGIVDAFDLDRQRQLVLVRRDNVEHLIMIGGPNDVVVEASIVRAQAAGVPAPGRDKDALLPAGPVAPQIPAGPPPLAAAPPSPAPAIAPPPFPAQAPPIQTAGPSAAAPIVPTIGAGPAPSGASADRAPPRPLQVPAAEVGPAGDTPPAPRPPQPAPPARPAFVQRAPAPGPAPVRTPPPPPSVAIQPAAPPVSVPPPAANPPAAASGGPAPPAPRPLSPAPPRPLSPGARPSLASSLPPRPLRPAPPVRPEPAAVPGRDADASGLSSDLRPTAAPDSPAAQEPPPRVNAASPPPRTSEPEAPRAAPSSKGLDTLESLEEEMAKLLGRPAPRRDG